MIVQAILVALITTCCTWWFSHVVTRTWLYPLWSGFLVGLVLGKPVEGMMIAAAINLPYVGFITAGGSMPGNPQFAGPVGTALALVSGLDVNSATTVGVILGSVTIMVWTAYMSINTLWVHMAEDFLNKGNIRAMRMCNYIPSFFVSFILNGIPAMLVVLYRNAASVPEQAQADAVLLHRLRTCRVHGPHHDDGHVHRSTCRNPALQLPVR